MASHGKKYTDAVRRFDREQLHDTSEAMTLVKSLKKSRGVWRESASTNATRDLTHTLDDLEHWLRYTRE